MVDRCDCLCTSAIRSLTFATHEMWEKILYAPLVPFCVFFFGRLHEGLAPLAERVRGAAPQEVVETEPAVSIDWRASVICLEAVRYHSSN